MPESYRHARGGHAGLCRTQVGLCGTVLSCRCLALPYYFSHCLALPYTPKRILRILPKEASILKVYGRQRGYPVRSSDGRSHTTETGGPHERRNGENTPNRTLRILPKEASILKVYGRQRGYPVRSFELWMELWQKLLDQTRNGNLPPK